MEFLFTLFIIGYVIYSVTKAFGNATQTKNLSQPTKVSAKPQISTRKGGAMTFEEILKEIVQENKKNTETTTTELKTLEIPSQELTFYQKEPSYTEIQTYEDVNYENYPVIETKKSQKIIKKGKQEYSNQELVERRKNNIKNNRISLTSRNTKTTIHLKNATSEELKKAFIMSEIFKRKF
jgi:Fe2+ transport system protein B